ncbi:MAG: TRAP transporter large permease subunit [Planctomycetota bacterium]
MLGGIFTATEAGVVACVYALVVSLFVRRTLRLRELWGVLLNAAITTAIVVGVISAAGGLAYLITFLRLDEWLRGALLSISDNGTVVVALLLVVMILLAMFIESLAVLVVLVPVIAQIGQAFGFDPLHFGMLIVVATQIGAVTPPVAVVLFVATSVAEARYDQTLRHCLPFIVALLLGLVLLFVFPALATFLPGLVTGGPD